MRFIQSAFFCARIKEESIVCISELHQHHSIVKDCVAFRVLPVPMHREQLLSKRSSSCRPQFHTKNSQLEFCSICLPSKLRFAGPVECLMPVEII